MGDEKAEAAEGTEKAGPAGVDFNAPIRDRYGVPITESMPTQEQTQRMRRCQAVASARGDSDDVRAALAELEACEAEVRDAPLLLGTVCVAALDGAAKDADAAQLRKRGRLAQRIAGTYDRDTGEGAYRTLSPSARQITMILDLVLETFTSGRSASVYCCAENLLHGRAWDDFGEDDE